MSPKSRSSKIQLGLLCRYLHYVDKSALLKVFEKVPWFYQHFCNIRKLKILERFRDFSFPYLFFSFVRNGPRIFPYILVKSKGNQSQNQNVLLAGYNQNLYLLFGSRLGQNSLSTPRILGQSSSKAVTFQKLTRFWGLAGILGSNRSPPSSFIYWNILLYSWHSNIRCGKKYQFIFRFLNLQRAKILKTSRFIFQSQRCIYGK